MPLLFQMKEARYFQVNHEVAFKLVKAIEGVMIMDRDEYLDTLELRTDLINFVAETPANRKTFQVYSENEFRWLHPTAVEKIIDILSYGTLREGAEDEVRNAIACLKRFIMEVKN